MQLLSSSFPNERLLKTYPVMRTCWVCHSKPTMPCNGTSGVWWIVLDGGKVGRTLGPDRPVPHLGLSSLLCCVTLESHVTSLNMAFLVYKRMVILPV